MLGWNPVLCRGKINAANLSRQYRLFIDDYARRYDISTALSTEEIISQIFSNGREWIPILDKHIWEGDDEKVDLIRRRVSPDYCHEALLEIRRSDYKQWEATPPPGQSPAPPRHSPPPEQPSESSRHSPLPGQFPDPPRDTYTPSPEPEPVPHGAGWTGSEPTSAYTEGESPRPRMQFVYPPPPKPLGRDAKGRERGFAEPSPNWLEEMLLDYEGIRRDMSNDMDELVLVAKKTSLEVMGLMGDIKEERKDVQILSDAITKICGKVFLDKIVADAKATVKARRASGNAEPQSSQSQLGEIRIPVDAKNKAILGRNPLPRLPRQHSHVNVFFATTSGHTSQNTAVATTDTSATSTQIAAKSSLLAPSGQVSQNGPTIAVTQPSTTHDQLPQRESSSSVAPSSAHATQKRSSADGAKARKSLPATEPGKSSTRKRAASEGPSNTRRTSARLSSSRIQQANKSPLKRPLEAVDEEADGEDSNNKASPKKARHNADQSTPNASNEDDEDDGNDAPKRDGGGGAVRAVQQQASNPKRSIEEVEQPARPGSSSPNKRARHSIPGNGVSRNVPAVTQPGRQEPTTPPAPQASGSRNRFPPLPVCEFERTPSPRPLKRQYNVFFSLEDPAAPKKTPPPPPTPLPQGAKTPVFTPDPSPSPSCIRGSTPPPAPYEAPPVFIGLTSADVTADDDDGAGSTMAEDGSEYGKTRKEIKRHSVLNKTLRKANLAVYDVGQGRKGLFRVPKKKVPEPEQPVASGSGSQNVNVNARSPSPDPNAPEPDKDTALRTLWFDPPPPVPPGPRRLTRQRETLMQDPLTGRPIVVNRDEPDPMRAVSEAAKALERAECLNNISKAINESHSIEVIHDESQFLDEEDEEVELPELLDRNGKSLI